MISRDPIQHSNPCSYFIHTFGCQMNAHDSEHVAGVLEDAGYERADGPGSAGLVVFNTCSVRGSAEDRVWGQLSAYSSKPAGGPLVAVFGCMAMRFGVDLLHRCPGVDLVFGLQTLERLPEMIVRCRRARICDTGDIASARYEHLPYRRQATARAWVPVSHGCDNSCSYCVVPFVRGPLRSRPAREILCEVESLVEQGVIEVTLLGQNVNHYGGDIGEAGGFACLLERVASIDGLRRVKFETSHPGDLTDDILFVMGSAGAACEYLHLPVQSGSDRVLSLMNRGYDRRYYEARVERARQLVPGLTLSTDIMVGFPGESENDFAESLDLARTLRFNSAYVFKYSRREETAAARMAGELSRETVSGRFEALRSLQDGITENSLKEMVGRYVEVLVEGRAKSGDYAAGRTRGHRTVLLPYDEAPPGSLVEALIEGAGKHAVRGSVKRVITSPSSG